MRTPSLIHIFELKRGSLAVLAAGGFALLMEVVQPGQGFAEQRFVGAFAAYYLLHGSDIQWPPLTRYPAVAATYLLFATAAAWAEPLYS